VSSKLHDYDASTFATPTTPASSTAATTTSVHSSHVCCTSSTSSATNGERDFKDIIFYCDIEILINSQLTCGTIYQPFYLSKSNLGIHAAAPTTTSSSSSSSSTSSSIYVGMPIALSCLFLFVKNIIVNLSFIFNFTKYFPNNKFKLLANMPTLMYTTTICNSFPTYPSTTSTSYFCCPTASNLRTMPTGYDYQDKQFKKQNYPFNFIN